MEDQILKNRRKTWLLFGVMIFFLLAIPFAIYFFTQEIFVPVFTLITLVVYIIFRYLMALKSFIKLSNAIPADRVQHRDFYLTVENTAIRLGLQTPKAYVIDDPALNAFTAGSKSSNYIIGATTGLLKTLDKVELEGVVAHEFGHILNKDTQVNTLAFIFILAFAFALDVIRFSSFSSNRRTDGRVILVLYIIALIGLVVAFFAKFAISRRREFLADAQGARITRHPDGLSSALNKISQNGSALKKGSIMTAHLFLSEPNKPSFLSRMFATHPPIPDRIAQLEHIKRSGY